MVLLVDYKHISIAQSVAVVENHADKYRTMEH